MYLYEAKGSWKKRARKSPLRKPESPTLLQNSLMFFNSRVDIPVNIPKCTPPQVTVSCFTDPQKKPRSFQVLVGFKAFSLLFQVLRLGARRAACAAWCPKTQQGIDCN